MISQQVDFLFSCVTKLHFEEYDRPAENQNGSIQLKRSSILDFGEQSDEDIPDIFTFVFNYSLSAFSSEEEDEVNPDKLNDVFSVNVDLDLVFQNKGKSCNELSNEENYFESMAMMLVQEKAYLLIKQTYFERFDIPTKQLSK